MKRTKVQQTPNATAYAQRFAGRWSQFFQETLCPGVVKQLEEAQNGPEHVATESSERCHLSIPEIFIRLQRDDWRSLDFLAVLTFVIRSKSANQEPLARTFFVGPATLRSHGMATSSGILITDLSIASVPCTVKSPWELSLLLYRIRSNAQSQRVLESMEQLLPALDYAADLSGSIALAGSLLDRVQVLSRSPDASPLLKGSYLNGVEGQTAPEPCYLALFQPPSSRDQERQLYVGDGHLLAGPPMGIDPSRTPAQALSRGIETATPCRFQDFALIRVGRKLDRKGPTRSIHQLRRERALSSGRVDTAASGDPGQRSYLDREARLRKIRRLTAIFGPQGMQRLPAVVPLAVEIAADLVPLVESAPNTLSASFQESLNQMKDGLRYELGIEVPGVRVRGNEADMPPGTYIILIDEIPLVMGTVSPDRALCNATVEQLASIGVTGENAVNPANGSECAWVREADWAKVRDEGKKIRPDGLYLWEALGYIVLHLSSVIRKNATAFLGIKAVADLIRAKNKTAFAGISAAPGGLPRFTTVLQMLLEEEVSILEFVAICDKYVSLANEGITTFELVEELRCLPKLRPALRLRNRGIAVYELGKNLVAKLQSGIKRVEDAELLAIEPELTQEALSAVRSEISKPVKDSQNPIILVEDWRLRRSVRKLVELEFPNLWVLARRDLADFSEPVTEIGVIEVE